MHEFISKTATHTIPQDMHIYDHDQDYIPGYMNHHTKNGGPYP